MWYTLHKGSDEAMIQFQTLALTQKKDYDELLFRQGERGCEYNFVNLYLWGRQKLAFDREKAAFFSQFNRKTVYPFPMGEDLKPLLDAILHDAQVRGIPCRLTGLLAQDCETLEALYPGKFRFHNDRDGYDYVYDIHDLADLKGRKYQKKRNHINRFRQEYAGYTLEPITDENTGEVAMLLQAWYADRELADPQGDYHMEKAAIFKALRDTDALDMEGLLLRHNGRVLAMTMGSYLNSTTFDVQFEKALAAADGAYPTICHEFARYLRAKYPELLYLNREDDMGIEGLRKAKLSWCPHHMIEKSWACLLEDGCDY